MTGARPFLIIVAIIIGIVVVLSLAQIFLKPRDGIQRVLSGTLLKSEDGGITWKTLDQFPGGEIININFDEASSSIILVGTKRRGIWRGNTAGDNWRQYPGGVGETSEIFDLIGPVRENDFIALVLFADRGRIIKFKEGGRTELFFTPLERFAFLKGYITKKGFIRVIGSDGGFYESANDGATWRSISRFREGLLLLAFNPKADNEVWVSDPKGLLYGSNDGGRSWQNLNEGLRKFDGTGELGFIFFDPGSGYLYHGSRHGLLRSNDNGTTWARVDLTVPPDALPLTAMTVDPSDSRKIYVSALNQIYISEDAGVSWKGIQVWETDAVSHILINPSNPKEIFIGVKSK